MTGWHRVFKFSSSDCLLSSSLLATSAVALVSSAHADQFPKRFPLASCQPITDLFREQNTDASGRRKASLQFGDAVFTLYDDGEGRLCERGCTMEHRSGSGEIERFAIVSDKVAEKGRPEPGPNALPVFSRDYYFKVDPGPWLWVHVFLLEASKSGPEKLVSTEVFDRGWSDQERKLTSCLSQ
jgi:hypothetical protein